MGLADALYENCEARRLLNHALYAAGDPAKCGVCLAHGYIWWICPPSHKGQKCREHRDAYP